METLNQTDNPLCSDGRGPLLEAGDIFTCDRGCPDGFFCEFPRQTFRQSIAAGICCPNLNRLFQLHGDNAPNQLLAVEEIQSVQDSEELEGMAPVCTDGKGPLLEAGDIFNCDRGCPDGFFCEFPHPTRRQPEFGICCPNLRRLYELYGNDRDETDPGSGFAELSAEKVLTTGDFEEIDTTEALTRPTTVSSFRAPEVRATPRAFGAEIVEVESAEEETDDVITDSLQTESNTTEETAKPVDVARRSKPKGLRKVLQILEFPKDEN